MQRLSAILLPFLLAATANASTTWIVDDSGGAGVHFTNLQTAINTVAAGDILLIRTGNYSAFTLSKELTLVGTGTSMSVSGTSKIWNLPAAERATVSRISFSYLDLLNCAGPIVCHDIFSIGAAIKGCSDVRFHASRPRNYLDIHTSRVELVSCVADGADGQNSFTSTEGEDGNIGIRCRVGSFVHLASTSASGGSGGNACTACGGSDGGNGMPAIYVENTATVIIAGQGSIVGGPGGHGLDSDGTDAPGIFVAPGGYVRWSRVSITGANGQPPISGGGTAFQTSPPDPVLTLTGTPTPGSVMTLTLLGWSDVNGRLQQGNEVQLVDDGQTIEQLNNRLRLHPLGPFAQLDTLTFAWTVPANFAPGHFRSFQGLTIDPATSQLIERANSVPIIVR